MRGLVILGLAACVVSLAVPALAASQTVKIGTAGVMGVYYPLGGAVCRMVNVTRKVHQLRCSVEPSEGSVANIRGVMSGGFEIRYHNADVELGRPFTTFLRDPRLDLGGWTYAATIGWRFGGP